MCGWWDDPTSAQSKAVVDFDPQLIVLQDGMNEIIDRQEPGTSTYRRPGDPLHDSWMRDEYQALFTRLGGAGRRFLLLNTVCADWEGLGDSWAPFAGGEGDRRISLMNNDYAALGATTSTPLTIGDLQSELCKNGKFQSTVEGVSDARPDGYHLSDEAADAVVARWLGPLALKTGGSSPTTTPSTTPTTSSPSTTAPGL
jgi:hypothetical protein